MINESYGMWNCRWPHESNRFLLIFRPFYSFSWFRWSEKSYGFPFYRKILNKQTKEEQIKSASVFHVLWENNQTFHRGIPLGNFAKPQWKLAKKLFGAWNVKDVSYLFKEFHTNSCDNFIFQPHLIDSQT